jgi:D-glycerate 3-kinase
MSSEMPDLAARLEQAVLPRLNVRRRPFVVGLCGAQGSGKSTVSAQLQARLVAVGYAVTTVSLDDLYWPIAERERLARDVHPLLRTRGVPGTHDVALGMDLFDQLGRSGTVRLPRFDKARDTRCPVGAGPTVEGPVDILLFEGWCVGAVPQPAEALDAPVNELERDDDDDAAWRRAVDAALGDTYQTLFDRIDMLVLLAAPDFAVVKRWRIEQEQGLRDRLAATTGAGGTRTDGVMTDADIGRFIQHYERLTRHILQEMPGRADVTVWLGPDRAVLGVTERALHHGTAVQSIHLESGDRIGII